MTEDDTFTNAIRIKIQGWLEHEEGWSLLDTPPLPSSEVSWALVSEDHGKRKFVFYQKAGHSDRVMIEANAVLSPDHIRKFAELPDSEQNLFLDELKIELLKMNVAYAGAKLPLQGVQVNTSTYFEGAFDNALAKDTFYQRVNAVRNGLVMVIVMLTRRLDHSPA